MTLKVVTLIGAALALFTFDAVASTWICDSKAAAGFDRSRGYEIINFNDGRSYRVRLGIESDELTSDIGVDKNIFNSTNESYRPASIQRLDQPIIEFCIYSKTLNIFSEQKSFIERIQCDSAFYGKFRFDLRTGLFSVVDNGFESLTSQTWAEVGECRRIN